MVNTYKHRYIEILLYLQYLCSCLEVGLLMGVWTIALKENCLPLVNVWVWVKVWVRIRVEGQFSSGAIVLEPC